MGIVFRHQFVDNLRQKVYCRDELVMQEGDTGDEMYVRLGVPLKLRDGGGFFLRLAWKSRG